MFVSVCLSVCLFVDAETECDATWRERVEKRGPTMEVMRPTPRRVALHYIAVHDMT
jgi:hypothetical protein